MGTLVQLVEASIKLRPETRRLYAGAVRGFETFCGSDVAAANANVDVIERWRDAQVATGLKPETVNVRVLALRWAARRLADRTENENLARATRATELLPTTRAKKPCPLDLHGVKLLVEACEGDRPVDIRDRAIVILATRTGLRRGGIAALDIADYQPPLLTVTLKGGARHTLPPSDRDTIAVLSAWRDHLASAGITSGRLFRSIRAQRDLNNRWVIGASMNGQSVYRVIRERGDRVGLKIQAHDCRRFFISMARHLNWPDWYTALWSGHRSVAGLQATFPMLDHYTSTLGTPPVAAFPSFS